MQIIMSADNNFTSEVELPEVPLAVKNRTLMILREYLRPN